MAKIHCSLVFSLLAFALIYSLLSSANTCSNSNQFLGMKEIRKKEKQKLLDAHNKYREVTASGKALGYQPPAENMLELGWDNYAAAQASSWANGCQFMHNDPKDKKNKPMGQNLYVKMSSKEEDVNTTFNIWVDYMVEGWYNESALYIFGSNFSGKTAHYTQLVWATTARIGCGYSYYKKNNWHVGYLVCNYSPAGNIFKENPYVQGNQNCSGYGLDRSTKYDHLCVKKNKKSKQS
uniref:Pc80, similar to Td16,antigen 5-like protein n=1 Tax=Panstrongylus chinai TaxID=156444 RepID=A0A286P0V7_9HEMI|nr:Pc80, similar to Td16,antigen 5-like protein [Panstrongylus chinai]